MERDAEQPSSLLCPLWEKRLPNTKVEYDEVVAAQTDGISEAIPFGAVGYHDNTEAIFRMQPPAYSSHSTSVYGDLMACAECAARYNRSVTLRARSRPLLNWSLVALVVSIVVTILTVRPNGSLWEALALAPLLVAVALFVISIGARVIGERLAQPMKRYLLGKRVKVPA